MTLSPTLSSGDAREDRRSAIFRGPGSAPGVRQGGLTRENSPPLLVKGGRTVIMDDCCQRMTEIASTYRSLIVSIPTIRRIAPPLPLPFLFPLTSSYRSPWRSRANYGHAVPRLNDERRLTDPCSRFRNIWPTGRPEPSDRAPVSGPAVFDNNFHLVPPRDIRGSSPAWPSRKRLGQCGRILRHYERREFVMDSSSSRKRFLDDECVQGRAKKLRLDAAPTPTTRTAASDRSSRSSDKAR